MSYHGILGEDEEAFERFMPECAVMGIHYLEDKVKLFNKAKECASTKKTIKQGLIVAAIAAIAAPAIPELAVIGFLAGVYKGTKSCMSADASEIQPVRLMVDDFQWPPQ